MERESWQAMGQVTAMAGGQARLAGLHAQMVALRDTLAAESAARMAGWIAGGAPMRAEFRGSAQNLADWLALRGADLSDVQPGLAEHGLSTLGRLDGHVRASVDAVIAALAALSGVVAAEFPDPAQMTSRALLAGRRNALFGDRPLGPQARIMVTLPGLAATVPGMVAGLARAGADCFRINCAHDDAETWSQMIAEIRAAETELARRLPVAMDLGGPKFRITRVHGDEKERLHPGDAFLILHEGAKAPKGALALRLSHPALVEALTEGAELSVDDGKLWAQVVRLGAGHAELRVTRAPAKGMRLRPEKGVNLPGAHLAVPALTEADLAALDFVARHADVVGYSFVQTVGDVAALADALVQRCPDRAPPGLMLKIETPLALRNLPDLVVAAGARLPVAVMIARGDLAVEIGFERLSEIQEEILWLCAAAQVPVVWATQVLETLVKEGQATRAEVTDAAMGQRAEAVMLNKGPHITRAVAFLRDVLARMDRHQQKKHARLAPLHLWRPGV